jgi:hypothetical protein
VQTLPISSKGAHHTTLLDIQAANTPSPGVPSLSPTPPHPHHPHTQHIHTNAIWNAVRISQLLFSLRKLRKCAIADKVHSLIKASAVRASQRTARLAFHQRCTQKCNVRVCSAVGVTNSPAAGAHQPSVVVMNSPTIGGPSSCPEAEKPLNSARVLRLLPAAAGWRLRRSTNSSSGPRLHLQCRWSRI